MISLSEDQGKRWFRIFLISVLVTFFLVRPMNSPWHPFISGDGLSYYSYLPATFIYNDHNYQFKWFNEVHNRNYVYSSFPNPEDNILVTYQDKKINKTYPGMSFVWLPFFGVAHGLALITGVRADGFTWPYQYAVCLASIISMLLGLYYLRRLILALTGSQLASLLVPAVIFYGTNYFRYGIAANSFTHTYSFALLNIALFHGRLFFHGNEKQARNLLIALFAFTLNATIRPLTSITLLLLPAIIPVGWRPDLRLFRQLTKADFLWILLILATIAYTLGLLYVQTGTPFPYTYTGETFDFLHPKLVDALASYHVGLLVYSPVLFFALLGIFKVRNWREVLYPLFFIGIIYLYSSWWYWPIVSRAPIDFLGMAGLSFAFLFSRVGNKTKAGLIAISVLCIIYFQFKMFQLNNGILPEYLTTREVFWKHFFRTRKTAIYPLEPDHILKNEVHEESFEPGFSGPVSSEHMSHGQQALRLDPQHHAATMGEFDFPEFFNSENFSKIRCTFRVYVEEPASLHAFISVRDTSGNEVLGQALYLNREDLPLGEWEEKQFGYEMPVPEMRNYQRFGKVVFSVWNVESPGPIYIDEAKFEFIVTSVSRETL